MRITELISESRAQFIPPSFKTSALEPVLTQKNVEWHLVNHKKYFKNVDKDLFNKAGNYLHNVWWQNLRPPQKNNQPQGKLAEWINTKFGSFEKFRNEWKTKALSIQGNGWIYLDISGIKTFKNHSRMPRKILLLLDMWEHSYVPTYGPKKDKYVDNMWKIYNWDVVAGRLG